MTDIVKQYRVRSGTTPGYCLYHPPASVTSLGLILYVHGAELAGSADPGLDAMLQWIASTGYTVVYPDVTGVGLPLPNWPTEARNALSAAQVYLAQQGKTFSKLAVAGFSLGGIAAARVAATWTGSPAISAIVLHDPAGKDFLPWAWDPNHAEWNLAQTALASIPASTYLVIVQAQSSRGTSNSAAVEIWNNTPQISKTLNGQPHKNFVLVRDDRSHSSDPNNVRYRKSIHDTIAAKAAAGIFSPGQPLTSMDYFGYWLPLFGAPWQAFFGSPFWGYSPYCHTATPAAGQPDPCAPIRSQGSWSDGVPATLNQNAGDLGY